MKESRQTPISQQQKRLSRESGQSLVEFALCMPLLMIILLGIAEFGWLAYNLIELRNAANAGAHYAAQTVITAADTTGIQTAVNNDAFDFSGITATSSNACSCSDGTAITCKNFAACVVPARIIHTVTVTTQKAVTPPIKVPGLPTSFTMHGTATMRVEE